MLLVESPIKKRGAFEQEVAITVNLSHIFQEKGNEPLVCPICNLQMPSYCVQDMERHINNELESHNTDNDGDSSSSVEAGASIISSQLLPYLLRHNYFSQARSLDGH